MKDIVAWLIRMETAASAFYNAAAKLFRNEEKLSAFLSNLAKDEDWHKAVMGEAIERSPEAKFAPPVILDEETALTLERLFTEGRENIAKGVFTKDELFACIIEAEFSEWNPLFVYTVNSLRENVEKYLDIGAKIQIHQKYINKFMEKTTDVSDILVHLEKFRRLPLVWRDRILVVDDEPFILKLLRALFETQWSVETATNGREALDKLSYSYFDVIVSDINMQPIDGIALYLEANKVWPKIGERFLFYSGNTMQYAEFLNENNLSYMMKPATTKELTKKVLSIANKEIDTTRAMP